MTDDVDPVVDPERQHQRLGEQRVVVDDQHPHPGPHRRQPCPVSLHVDAKNGAGGETFARDAKITRSSDGYMERSKSAA
ncbi:MAG: hypothetical protein E6G60_02175 [Actinobacteria bacterium]|nr:MAG: hypothetical protein E6G60_02175 [Actinomycetota bacterium]